jgi:nucleotidyltransferase AbiEii toxin of type IV toxin-antitoxin system
MDPCRGTAAFAARVPRRLAWSPVPDGDLDRIFAALDASGARYLVVGGVAVVLHGHPRFTADLDLVLALDPDNLSRALPALEALGYRPRAPVSLTQFVDPAQRQLWIDEKSMTVFSLWSPQLPATEIDLFAAEPLPFEAAYRRALRADLGATTATVASLRDLIALKRSAGRPQDLEDASALEAIERALAEGDGD